MRAAAALFLVACASSSPPPAVTPVPPTPALAAGMAKLSFMRGVWVGPASGTTPTGAAYTVTQTERMGPMLGGDIVVIEGRGYRPDGTTGFNAFAVVSFDPSTGTYELRSYAMGYAGTFALSLTADGYTWDVPAGPDARIHYTATVRGDTWREVGEYIAGDATPVKMFEMNLRRVADTEWPLGTPVPPSAAAAR